METSGKDLIRKRINPDNLDPIITSQMGGTAHIQRLRSQIADSNSEVGSSRANLSPLEGDLQ